MKVALAIAVLTVALSATAQRPVSVNGCARVVPEMPQWITNLQSLRAELGRPRMAGQDYDMEVSYASSCESYAREIRERIVRLESERGDDAYLADTAPAPRRRAPPVPSYEPRAEDYAPRLGSAVPRVQGGVLIVTDEDHPRAAQRVALSFQQVAPFSCLRVPVAIHRVSRSQLGCRPHGDGRPRIIKCVDDAKARALAWRDEAGAQHVIIVTQHAVVGGNGGLPPVVTDTIINGPGPLAGLHELMHTLGFDDTYVEGAPVAVGDIMACTGPRCRVLEQDFGKVAAGLGRVLPPYCR